LLFGKIKDMAKNLHHDQAKTIDDYISGFPEDIRGKLEEIRTVIRKAAPQAEETISYGMPAFKLNGVLVYFAAFKDHIGFFPTASGVSHFQKELKAYDISKGTIRLPLDAPLPLDLINKIVEFRVSENLNKNLK
jgi:uncharacterized protein YdhG (YjbR/CyaY superfamily)